MIKPVKKARLSKVCVDISTKKIGIDAEIKLCHALDGKKVPNKKRTSMLVPITENYTKFCKACKGVKLFRAWHNGCH